MCVAIYLVDPVGSEHVHRERTCVWGTNPCSLLNCNALTDLVNITTANGIYNCLNLPHAYNMSSIFNKLIKKNIRR